MQIPLAAFIVCFNIHYHDAHMYICFVFTKHLVNLQRTKIFLLYVVVSHVPFCASTDGLAKQNGSIFIGGQSLC